MLKQVVDALERQDYATMGQLLQQWQRQSPDDPWLPLYLARWQEGTQDWQAAEATYRQLLQQGPAPKIAAQARQGLERLQVAAAHHRAQTLAAATQQPGGTACGLLLLEAVPPEMRDQAAQGLASVMQLDPYTARLQLPARGWRLYRVGPIGELQVYGQALQVARTPAFWASLEQINAPQVFRVDYFRSIAPRAVVVCQNAAKQLGTLAFDWQEVSQQVTGLLPIFESVVDRGPWGKLERKQKTQDYAYMLDLHLHGRRSILRLCDRTYQFQNGNPFDPAVTSAPDATVPQPTTRSIWNQLLEYINGQVTGPTWTDFSAFGEGALEYIDLLDSFPHYIDLNRRQSSNWDAVYQIYSGLAYLQYAT